MKDKEDYSEYECPYSHLEKECGHELKGPEGYEETYSVWCACGFRGPVFYLEPEQLGLKKKTGTSDNSSSCDIKTSHNCERCTKYQKGVLYDR